MTSINAVIGDIKISVNSIPDSNEYVLILEDSITRESKKLITTSEIIHAIFSVALHPEGMPIGVDSYYAIMETILKDLPIYLMPVP